jgi:glycosyltransferase involved in cell wall biosynthesis
MSNLKLKIAKLISSKKYKEMVIISISLKEKISIIVPVYNMEAYIKRCLDSIYKQSYKNLEIIIVDDGSSDDSLKICKEFVEKDNRVKIISQNNQGVSAARNTGIDNATGEYVAFVDSDDYIHPEMYERLYSLLKKNHADVTACFIRGCWDSNYSEPSRDDIKIEIYNKLGAIKSVFDPKYEINGTGVVVTNKLYKRSIFNNLRFSTDFKTGEDEQIICFIMKKIEKFVITDERLYYYFNRSDSAVHIKTTEMQKTKQQMNLLKMYEERMELFNEDEFLEIYKTCYFILMNLTITSFYYLSDKNVKNLILKRYQSKFNEFSRKILKDMPVKDKIRFLIFRMHPQLYNLVVLKTRRNNNFS